MVKVAIREAAPVGAAAAAAEAEVEAVDPAVAEGVEALAAETETTTTIMQTVKIAGRVDATFQSSTTIKKFALM